MQIQSFDRNQQINSQYIDNKQNSDVYQGPYQNSSIYSEDIEEKHIKVFTSIKGHNSVVQKRVQPICNPKPLLPDINVHAKLGENLSKAAQVRVRKRSADWRTDGHSNDSEGIT